MIVNAIVNVIVNVIVNAMVNARASASWWPCCHWSWSNGGGAANASGTQTCQLD